MSLSAEPAPDLPCHVRARREPLRRRSGELVSRCGVTRQTPHPVETGAYVPNTLVALQLARALDCRVEDLFSLPESQRKGRQVQATVLESAPADQPSPAGTRVQLAQMNPGSRSGAGEPVAAGSAAVTSVSAGKDALWPTFPLPGQVGWGQVANGALRTSPTQDGRAETELFSGLTLVRRRAVPVGCDKELNKTQGVLASGAAWRPHGRCSGQEASVKRYGVAEVEAAKRPQGRCSRQEGYPGAVPGYPGIGATPYDPSLELVATHVARHSPDVRPLWRPGFCLQALRSLARGEAHAAGIRLWEASTGVFDPGAGEREFPGQKVRLHTLWKWKQGLMAARGNPHGLRAPEGLLTPGLFTPGLLTSGLRLYSREVGAGSRDRIGNRWWSGTHLHHHRQFCRTPGAGSRDTRQRAGQIERCDGGDQVSLSSLPPVPVSQ